MKVRLANVLVIFLGLTGVCVIRNIPPCSVLAFCILAR